MKPILLAVTVLGIVVATDIVITPYAYAQTQGMERRSERRENRQDARSDKRDCKAGDEATRPECRQQKREAKREGRDPDDDVGHESEDQGEQE